MKMHNPRDRFLSFGWGDLCRAYWFLLGNLRWKWFFLALALFVINFYILIPPLMVGKIVDFFTAYRPGNSLSNFYIYVSILGISLVIVSFLRLSIKNAIGNLQSEVMYRTRVKGFEKLLNFSLAWHLDESAGAKAQRIRSGVEAYGVLTRRLSNEIIRSITSIIGVMAVFLFLRPQYVIFFLLYVLGFWIILLLFYRRIHRENDLYFHSVEKAGGSYVEGLSNVLTIKTLGADSSFKEHISLKERTTKEHEIIIRNLSINMWKGFQAFNGICYGVFLFLVGRDVIKQEISAGSLVVFYGYLHGLVGYATDMMDVYETILNAKSGIGRMMGIFWTKISISAGREKLPDNWDAVRLSEAQFLYAGKSSAGIKNISVSMPRYAKIGVVGKTGSGKSTLAKILAGLYPLSSGTYAIGGVSFYQLANEEQTKQVTLVLQETEVFNFSLKDNITLMRETDPLLLKNALEIAQLSEFVEKLPRGLNTIVGEKGYHLSGGERQRVGIARAIYKNSPILIFDEATSSLDSKTELLIQHALETRLQNKTVISIAHRVSTLQKTDIIYVFDEGEIVEQGTFNELSTNTKSKFYELYKGQSKS